MLRQMLWTVQKQTNPEMTGSTQTSNALINVGQTTVLNRQIATMTNNIFLPVTNWMC